jgi:hypothetical protein
LLIRASGSKSLEQGSLAPLGLGLALVSLATVLVVVASGSVYITERRLTSVAESTALAVLIAAKGDLSRDLSSLALEYLREIPPRGLHEVDLIEAASPDSKTVRVRLCSTWRPIFENYMFSEIGRVCSEGLARRGR